MITNDSCCTIAPYFTIHEGKQTAVEEICGRLIEKTKSEEKCLYYGFSFDGDLMFCREAYEDAAGLLFHLQNVGSLLEELLTLTDLTRLEIHAPEEEQVKLREPLEKLKPRFFTVKYGFRR